jgi:hypothetical protein
MIFKKIAKYTVFHVITVLVSLLLFMSYAELNDILLLYAVAAIHLPIAILPAIKYVLIAVPQKFKVITWILSGVILLISTIAIVALILYDNAPKSGYLADMFSYTKEELVLFVYNFILPFLLTSCAVSRAVDDSSVGKVVHVLALMLLSLTSVFLFAITYKFLYLLIALLLFGVVIYIVVDYLVKNYERVK